MITKKQFSEIIVGASEAWRRDRKELISCFDSEKLWEVIHAHVDLEPDRDLAELTRSLEFGEPNKRSIMRAAIDDLGPDQELLLENAIELALDRAFLTLFDRGALQKLLVVDEVPPKAQRDMDRIAANVEAAKPKKVVSVASPPPPEDPIDVCVRDFHEMGMQAFKTKYLNNQNNRRFYEAAIEAGRL